jgi:hypothetical protein
MAAVKVLSNCRQLDMQVSEQDLSRKTEISVALNLGFFGYILKCYLPCYYVCYETAGFS